MQGFAKLEIAVFPGRCPGLKLANTFGVGAAISLAEAEPSPHIEWQSRDLKRTRTRKLPFMIFLRTLYTFLINFAVVSSC